MLYLVYQEKRSNIKGHGSRGITMVDGEQSGENGVLNGQSASQPIPGSKGQLVMHDVVERVKRHIEPAMSLLVNYLELFAEHTGLGGIALYWDDRETLERVAGILTTEPLDPEVLEVIGSTRLFPSRNRRFCALLRHSPKGNARCYESDGTWSVRAARTKRIQIYQCHAGLTDIVVPVLVLGKYVGRIVTGQLVHHARLPRGFSEVWERIRDLDGLDKEEMAEAFRELGTVNEGSLRKLATALQGVAQTIGNLWERLISVVVQEKQLNRMHLYLEREFAESLLNGAVFSEDHALVRGRALGLEELPTVAVVAQMDFTDRATFAMTPAERQEKFGVLVDVVHEVSRDAPNSLVTSIRPGELVMLLRPPETRNPKLKSVRLEEIARAIEDRVKQRAAVSVRVGIGPDHGSPARLADSYHQARLAAGQGLMASGRENGSGHDDGSSRLLSAASDLAAAMRELADAVHRASVGEIHVAFEKLLRIMGGFPDEDYDARRLLFAQVVDGFLEAARDTGADREKLDRVRAGYAQNFPALRTMDDIVRWFRDNLTAVAHDIAQRQSSPEERAITEACRLVNKRLDESVKRNDVAAHVGMSESHFGKVFRKRLGVSFRDYLQMARVARAQQLLLEPGKSILDIAVEVGYADTASFTHAFKKTCGASPTQYRNAPRAFKRIELPHAAGQRVHE